VTADTGTAVANATEAVTEDMVVAVVSPEVALRSPLFLFCNYFFFPISNKIDMSLRLMLRVYKDLKCKIENCFYNYDIQKTVLFLISCCKMVLLDYKL
jgi:hypothetical protein